MTPRTAIALGVAAAISAAAVGCTLTRQQLLRTAAFRADLGGEGRLIVPRRVEITLRTVQAPLGDSTLDRAVWTAADEQAVVDEEARRTLEANGLRLGVIDGPLPAELERLVNAPPPHKVDPVDLLLTEDTSSLIRLTPEPEGPSETSVLMARNGRAGGKIYQDLRGYVRILAVHDGPDGVSIRVVPELHHGPILRRFQADAGPAPIGPQQLLMKDGQQEDTLRELAATVVLRPGQFAVLGCRADRPSSLGHVLFTAAEPNSDRLTQKLILIVARRNTADTPGNGKDRSTVRTSELTPGKADADPAPAR